jgi:hypothetical protein
MMQSADGITKLSVSGIIMETGVTEEDLPPMIPWTQRWTPYCRKTCATRHPVMQSAQECDNGWKVTDKNA